MQQRIRKAMAALILPLVAAGCAVLVDPEALSVRCAADPMDPTSDPCRALGLQCIDGLCQTCDADTLELCNGFDDDCDGVIDEDQDTDGDGFTWCGGGRVELADCSPKDREIHPGNLAEGIRAPEEECDGKDNDCDTRVDEDSDCMVSTSCVDTGCPENQRCDVATGGCFVPREVGSGCKSDADCKGGFCLRPGTFGLSVALMDNRCASACCTDDDCGDDGECVISDSGARACLPRNIAGGGTKTAGVLCVRDVECESGLCLRSTCQTRCFTDEQCATAACVLNPGSAAEPRRFVCAMPDGRVASGETCNLTGCRSNLCTEEFLCATPCARDGDCGMNEYCEVVDVRPGLLGPTAGVSICARRANGGAEVEDVEHLCCSNFDCGEGALCAPSLARPGQWHMTCRGE